VTGTVQPPALHTTAEKLARACTLASSWPKSRRREAAAKRDKKGIPSARARVHALVDPGPSWRSARSPKPRTTPTRSTVTMRDGHGMIDGRPVGVFSHGPDGVSGTVGEMFGRKVAKLMEWCAMAGCPIIGIQDSGGARIQDAVTSLAWYAELGRVTRHCPAWCRRSPSFSANVPGERSIRRFRTIFWSRFATRVTSLSPGRT